MSPLVKLLLSAFLIFCAVAIGIQLGDFLAR
ncbi:hypothetical protein SDC9_09145 [bioreactor metagenome]|uniref:Uncharacterized protein n=1 Tax=bioreactor metagenome TaxID=1076179 RepID=A0A644T9P2_9ZZZZ